MTLSLTRDQFEAAREHLSSEHGIMLDGDNGLVESDGIELTYEYNGESLTVTVKRHPLLKPTWAIEKKIKEWLNDQSV